jgi:hypothetical protein
MTHAKSGKARDACCVKNRDTPPPGLAFGEPSGGRRRLRVWRVGIHQIRFRDLAARCARVVAEFFAPMEGVGNAGCPLHPRPRVHFVLVERTRVTTSTPERPAFPHAMVLTAYVVLSPVTGLFCHRRQRIKVLSKPGRARRNSANLTPASGRQDHTILPSASNISRQRAGDRSQVPKNPPCDPIARKTLPRPPHTIPRS